MSDAVQEAFDKLNERRVTLIARQHTPDTPKLDAAHTRELAELTARCDAVIHALFPLPSIEAMAERLGLPVPGEDRQLEMLYACAPPDCAWCGAAHEGGPECCEDNQSPPEPAEGAENRLGGRTGPP